MKKKLIPLILALVCAAVCAFGFTACTDSPAGPQTVAVEKVELNKTAITLEIDGTETLTATVTPDNATDKTVTWSSSAPAVASVDNTGKVTAKAEGSATITAKTSNDKTAICAVTVNAAAPKTEVTAAEWTKALTDAKNFTYVWKMGEDYTSTNKIDGDKLETSDTDGEHEILVKDGGKYYMYAEYDGSWVRRAYTAEEAEEHEIDEWLTGEQQLLLVCKDDFGSFTYADGKYTAATLDKTQTMRGTLKNVVAKFEDGKLVEVTFDFYQSDGDGDKMEFELKNVGMTTVTAPANYTEYDPEGEYKVTAEEWDEIMDSTDNFTLTTTTHYGTDPDTSIEKFDGAIRFVEESNGAKRVYFDGQTYYYAIYRYDNGTFSDWRIGESANPAVFDTLSATFKGKFDSFTYADGKYTAENLVITIESYPVTFTEVEITFENGELQHVFYRGSKFECTIENVGDTSFEVPALCPVENGQTIEIPVGTKVKELYETCPALSTVLGKWELYMYYPGAPGAGEDGYMKLGDEEEMPEGPYTCKLVYNGEASEQPEDVTFTLKGLPASE